MATTSDTMQVELTYTDYDTRTYKIPFQNYTAEGIAAAKTAIRNFNQAAQTENSEVRQTFISNNGASVASINSATLIHRTEDVIYSVG